MLTLNRNRGSLIGDMDTCETRLMGPELIVSEMARIRMHGLLSMVCGTGSFCSFSISLSIVDMTALLQEHSCWVAGQREVRKVVYRIP